MYGVLYFLLLEKCQVVDFKFDNSFLKLQPKNTQIKYFWCQILTFLVLHVDFKYSKSIFKLESNSDPKFKGFFLLHETLQLDKFECNDFK